MKQNKKFLKLLIDQNLSKTQLSQKLNVSWQTVYYWSIGRNKPSAQKALELSKILGLSVEQILQMFEESKKK